MKLGRCENCDTLREMLHASEKRNTDLMEKYHALRTLGANAASVGLPPASRSKAEADQAIEQMVEKYPHFRGLRRRLQQFVHAERQKPNADEAKIATMVVDWPTDDEDGD